MKIAIQTWGSTGDCRPTFALAQRLRRAGHDVTLAVTCIEGIDFSDLCRRIDVRYIPVPERIDIDVGGMMKTFGHTRNDALLLKKILEVGYFPFIDAMYATALELCETHDVMIAHFLHHAAKTAATITGTPYAAIIYWPGFVPTAARPPYPLPGCGRPVNRLLWWTLWRVLDFTMGRHFLALPRKKGLRPARAFPDLWMSDRLNLLAASPSLWPAESDWGPTYELTGFWNLPEEAEAWEPSDELAAFLDGGEPPVYFTFGTPQKLEAERNMDLLISAARRIGCRAIIQTSSERFPADTSDGDIFFAPRLSHQAVFPRCACVVHHGGAGTTHSSIRAGMPSVVVGFLGEQMSWGRQLQKAGVALRPLHRRDIKPGTIARAVGQVLESKEMQARAVQLGAKIREEDGTARAAEVIEQRMQ